jgi:hypothetical protein
MTWRAMMLTLPEDQLDVLREIAAIERDLWLFEQQHGPTVEAEDARRRLREARSVVLEQLRGPLVDATGTIH